MDKTQSLIDLIEEKITNVDIRMMVLNKIADFNKGAFAKHVSRQISISQQVPAALGALVDEIAVCFR
ncbi:hypothetical protein CR105_00270 [Massilia eurypsychrophila]|uniref:Uncharacterized protein n=2 Tax=Massilia eurypsychrophila TaxID=1485217 RepID=A0A2G8TKV9_9BURK|nr:hypothetical protein CR105_00270 [Massilia eurypsychrophila]